MRHPAFHYMRFLVFSGQLPASNQPADWREALELSGLGGVSASEQKLVLESISPPAGVFVNPRLRRSAQSVPAVAWLRDQGLYDLCYPDSGVRRAIRLLDQGRLRQLAERLLCCGMTPKETAHHLSEIDGTIDEDVILTFSHYWWSIDRMSSACWDAYLRSCPRWNTDRLSLASGMIVGRLSALSFLRKAPQQDVQEAFAEVFEITMNCIRELAAQPPGVDKAQQLGQYARTIVRVGQERNKSDQAVLEVQRRFNAFQTIVDETEIPSAAALIEDGGTISTSGVGAVQRIRQDEGTKAVPVIPKTPPRGPVRSPTK